MKSSDNNGYRRVHLSVDGKQRHFLLHRLLAQAFLPNPHQLATVNHINGLKSDNRLCNLEWSSYRDNLLHAVKMGLNVAKRGEESHARKLTLETVEKIRDRLSQGVLSQARIGELFGVSRGCVQAIKNGKTWRET